MLVGLMGAGKTSIGRRLARALGAPFADADDEIVAAAGLSIPDIFALYGEPRFRELERRVVARLLDGGPMVLALGGGAFVDPETRARVAARGVSVWLRADLETLVARTSAQARHPPAAGARRPARHPGGADAGALPDLRRGRPHGRLAGRAARVGGRADHGDGRALGAAETDGRRSVPSAWRWASAATRSPSAPG